jgi:signal transduction histidine kinase
VTVSIDAGETLATVAVRDQGPGFEADDLAHIFDAGWRGSSARTAPRMALAGGAGLGLAITRAIIEAHGGTVGARDTGGGAEVRLQLPLGSAPR